MLYMVGFRTETKEDVWSGKYQCPKCGIITNHHLYKVKICGYMFFIPIASKTIKRGMVCDKCQNGSELSKGKYNSIKTEQKIKFKNGDIPVDVIKQDYNPQKIKWGTKIFGIIILSLFSLMNFLGTIGMISDIKIFDASVVIAAIIMPLIGFLPLFFAVRRANIAKKKKKLYDMACKNQWD